MGFLSDLSTQIREIFSGFRRQNGEIFSGFRSKSEKFLVSLGDNLKKNCVILVAK